MVTPLQQLPRDAALPQMATALNAAAMREVFQRRFFAAPHEQRFQIRACDIVRIKHKLGQNCLVCYRLDMLDTQTQENGEQILCARIYEPGGARSRFAKAQSQALAALPFGQPLMHLPELEMVVWTFPNDRKLHGLPKIVDPVFLQHELLPEAIAAHWGHHWKIAELTCNVVHYVPEHTCTVKVEAHLRHSQIGTRQVITLFGKTYYNDEGAETYENMITFWHGDARRRGELGLAQPFAYHPATKSLWQIGLPGKTLMEHDMRSADFLALLPAAAANVAALHRSTVACSRSSRLEDVCKKLGEMQALLAKTLPARRNFAEGLVHRLLRQSERFDAQPAATLHGDLHLKNFFVDAGKVSLIDLDNLCSGAPLQDVGSFVAGLWYRGILANVEATRMLKIIEVFTRAYKQRVPWYVSNFELDWHTAAALVNERVFRCLTRLKAGRLDIINGLLALANKIMA